MARSTRSLELRRRLGADSSVSRCRGAWSMTIAPWSLPCQCTMYSLSTRSAIAAFELFLDTHPDSPLRGAVVQERKNAIDSLAMHELAVARWQVTREFDWDAAIDRVKFALEAYPETTLKCDLLFTMAEAYKEGDQFEDAIRYYEQVTNEYPDCELVEDAQERIREINGV